jgi:hypothetical protein
MIITVKTTIMDGTVVRWYRRLDDANIHRPVLSASRNGVRVHDVYLHEIPDEVLSVAQDAYAVLRRDPHADVHHLATHVNRGPTNGPLVPVEEVGSDG